MSKENGLTSLLKRAQISQLALRIQGNRLIIEGPDQAEPLARELLRHEAEVVSLLSDPALVEACPVCQAEILRVQAGPALYLEGCSANEDHYYRRIEREPGQKAEPSLALRMLHAPTSHISGRRSCYSEGCGGLVEFERGCGVCPSCGLAQRVVDLDEASAGGVISFRPQPAGQSGRGGAAR